MSWWYGREYESVEQKRRKAEKLIAKLRTKHADLKPVSIDGRSLVKTFWGKAWCKQMDLMADYDNRLPRGRSYARNGAICHLEIRQGEVEAWVSGSSLYTVKIQVTPLESPRWKRIQEACKGRIATLLDLLQGKLSKEVMAVVCDPEAGIFPRQAEISYTCSCPDSAMLCKHAAAVFYGVGSRLDEAPDLLFLLRHVAPAELFSLDAAAPVKGSEAALLQGVNLGGLFGIELMEDAAMLTEGAKPQSTADSPVKKEKKRTAPEMKALTGKDLAMLRDASGLSFKLLARRLGVTEATLQRWESTAGIIRLQERSRKKLQAFQRELRRKG